MFRGSLVLVLFLSLLVPLSPAPASAQAQELAPILVYTGNGALNQGYTKFGQAAGRNVVEQATLPADLSAYGCVVLPTNAEAFSAGQTEQFNAYVNGGGRLFAFGDHEFFSLANANMNALATALGSGLSIIPEQTIDNDIHVTTNVEPSVFTQGVNSIGYASTSQITATGDGQVLVRTQGTEGVPFIGVEEIGNGRFILSGDTNAFSDKSAVYENTDNGRLVFNLCSMPLDPVLVYTGNGSYNSGYTLFGQAAGRPVEEHATLPADLSGYGCVILPRNATAFSQDQLDQFVAYVQAGGRLFALGEWGVGPDNQDANANLTTLAGALGSGLAIVNGETESALTETTNIEPSDFTTGVTLFNYLNTSSLTVTGEGQVLVRTQGESGVPFIGAETIGAGLFVLAGDTNIFSDYEPNAYEGSDNGQMAFNLCSGSLNQPPTVTVSGVTEGAEYEFGAVPAATCLVEDHEGGPSSFPATLSDITGSQAALGLGSQTASCSYTDDGGLEASASVSYSIVDITAPVLDPLPDLIVPATGPTGATVAWTATAEDAVEGTLIAECTPVSGSFFSIPDPRSDATTTVNCSTTDSSDNVANDSFTVTVLGAVSQLDLLRIEVQESEIHAYAIRGLDRALASAENGLERNRLSTTCFQLNYFQTQVNLYGWMGQVPSGQAGQWLADAARIKTVLGCSV